VTCRPRPVLEKVRFSCSLLLNHVHSRHLFYAQYWQLTYCNDEKLVRDAISALLAPLLPTLTLCLGCRDRAWIIEPGPSRLCSLASLFTEATTSSLLGPRVSVSYHLPQYRHPGSYPQANGAPPNAFLTAPLLSFLSTLLSPLAPLSSTLSLLFPKSCTNPRSPHRRKSEVDPRVY
jgi:hypothetical protein